MRTSALACVGYTDDGGSGDPRATTGNQPCVLLGERRCFVNNIFCKSHECPASPITVEANLNLTVKLEDVGFDFLSSFIFVKNDLWMEVNRTATQRWAFKCKGFRHTGGSALYGVETVANVAMASVQSGYGSNKARSIGRNSLVQLFQ